MSECPPCRNARQEQLHRDFAEDAGLTVGDTGEVYWTAGSFGHFHGRAQIIRVNAQSVRVKLLTPITATRYDRLAHEGEVLYTVGSEIVVPRYLRNTWASFNRFTKSLPEGH
jgi:uncharacterized membrane protein YadS